jgi:uncharacterized protein (DUF111 family)
MKILYLDCFAGISGDMFLGAMLDLGLSPRVLRAELAKLKLTGYRISTRRVVKQNISATKFDCFVTEHAAHHPPSPRLRWASRSYTDIAAMIQKSALSDNVKRRALNVFRRIGEA